MAFFGLSQPHDTRRPGFGPTPDAFAGLARAGAGAEEDEGIDFEDTYDGLGDELDDNDDAFNDETFGSVEKTNVGKDFDFYGQTAQVADTITEEQMVYGRKVQKPPPQTVQQSARRTVRLEDSQQIPDLKPEMSLWQTGPVQQEQPKQSPYNTVPVEPPQLPAPRKILSLEEVEAQLLAQARTQGLPQQPQGQDHHAHMLPSHAQGPMNFNGIPTAMQQGQMNPQNLKQLMSFQAGINQQHQGPQYPQQHQVQIPLHLQQQQQQQQQQQKHHNIMQQQQQQLHQQHQFHQHQQAPHIPSQHGQNLPGQDLSGMRGGFPPVSTPHAPTQIQQTNLNTPQELLLAQQMQDLRLPPTGPANSLGVNTQFLAQLQSVSKPEQDRLLQEESKRLKRNLKIAQLATYNGLMTPNDKNYITRMQLQQLVALNEDAFTEDFYYQVHSAIQARSNPQQPLNQFAQTYLFQQGQNNRGMRHRRQDNHLQRMEQQVQRAVAAAKARPKASQLVLEGSLGKISFSNVKTPRPMLSIKSTGDVPVRKNHKSQFSGPDKKSILSSIEKVYDALLDLEMHERNLPPPLQPEQPLELVHIEHQQKQEELVLKLWDAMRILEPINPDPNVRHPFIAMLAYAKGKRAIPRIFRFVSNDQRTLIVTMIVAHLDVLDVVKGGLYHANETQLPTAVREEIELFCQTILPPLLQYVSEAPLNIVIGLLGLLLERVDLGLCSQTKLGLQFLTMFLSRGEIIKEAAQAEKIDLSEWTDTYNKLFDRLIPHLHSCFPPASNFVDDIYVWQFLASIAVGATMLQQQQLVEAVKERVMENYETSKTLPPELAAQKLANVNLFMRAIGLDVDLLG